MRAAVLSGGTFVVDDVPDPTPGPGELILRVSANGICGSDLSTYSFLPDGTIMGHEFAGEVVAVDPSARGDWPIGVPVAAMPVIGCRACPSCAVGDQARCPAARTIGLGVLPGALAEYVRVGIAESVRLDTLAGDVEVDLDAAALVEPLAVGLHALRRASPAPGDRVLVLGAGPVGLAVIAWAAQQPVSAATCADPVSGRRDAALRMGATEVLHPEEVRPDSFDIVVDCVGKPGIIATAIQASAPRGTVVVAGVCMAADTFMPVAGVVKEISMHFVSYYSRDEFVAAARLVATGRLDHRRFVSARVPLEQVASLFAELARPNDHRKVLVTPRRR
ncbi:alcohol dehydrogenase catalytic domain-containing protein [Gordonia soli]|uniref:Putative zinc-containing alcohol dehydrogenase n=1 Tax=Gordonia soli NBRC 108243 TaxID=1223545 RepID=M0QHP6_9ACTN|nr:alcohol dehydrogenase catalytic domain-containing protein [Gordonia soli]GAC67821.1 putative zinc-containing alcohol dehydrogenase [Gordonia soli NBRC 108243]